MPYEGFVNLGFKPKSKDVQCLFYIEPPKGKTLAWSAERIAGESSIGTWVDVVTEKKAIGHLSPTVYRIKKNSGFVYINYPIELFEPGNMPSVWSGICGNIYGMKEVVNLRLVDVRFPLSFLKAYSGPKYGIEGVRKLLKVKKRPLIGTIVKPKLGLPPREHARVAYEAWVGGCDIVKDDENLSSQKFNPFEERTKITLRMKEKAEKETGEPKAYLVNVTAEAEEMIRRAHFAKKQGANYIMVDVVTVGMSGLQTLREYGPQLPLHAHRAMHAMITRNKKHGMTMLALGKFLRLIGVDTLHVGTGEVGKMEGNPRDANETANIMRDKKTSEGKTHLPQDWAHIRPLLPVASGGLYAGSLPKLVEIFGTDFVAQAGGGVHGHPDGTRAGAVSMRQALDSVMKGIPLEDYAKTHIELKKALQVFK
jgi:ribulose-bisphosphate carboxylase large chain